MHPSRSPLMKKTIELGRDRNSVFGKTAFLLCKGIGIEVGAVNCPFDVDADVFYLDQYDGGQVAAAHAADPNVDEILPVSFVSQRPPYNFIATESFDFVIASHVIEHLANPLASIEEFYRIIRPGGIIYLVVPHKDFSFDKDRIETSLLHFVIEYIAQTRDISIEHYLEHLIQGVRIESLSLDDRSLLMQQAVSLFEKQSDFHVHTFTHTSFWGLLDWWSARLGAEIVHTQWNDLHIHAAIRKPFRI